MLNVFFRTLLLYVLVIIVMRIMGKRQIGQLQPFELAATIMISELAAIPMQNLNIPLINGIIPIMTLLTVQLTISLLTYVSPLWRKILDGNPSILINNGKISEPELRREMYSISDLLEQLRLKDFHHLDDIEFVTLETNGDISIIPKAGKIPPTMSDLQLPVEYKGLPLELVVNGKIIQKNIDKLGLSKNAVTQMLKEKGILSIERTLIAILDSNNNLYAHPIK